MSRPRILMSPPDVGLLEKEYVDRAIASGWLAPAGPDLAAFEREVAERCEVPFAVGLSSGTAALHLAMVSWGIGPGDVVVTSTMTFAATANAIAYTGAQPYFVDCDPSTANMDPDLLEDALDTLSDQDRRVAAVVPVDMLGKCCDYESIEKVIGDCGPPLLCDAAESMGATYRSRPAGSIGAASALSFNGNKIMTTSGGGMLLTRDAELAERSRYLSTQARQPVAHYEHTEIGYNYRLSNVLAALGRAQLTRLDDMLARRRNWRERYRRLFASYAGIDILGGDDDHGDNCWLTAVTVDPAVADISAAELRVVLGAAGIESRPVWKPLHLQPAFGHCAGTINGSAERLFTQGVTLPSGSGMTSAEFARIESIMAETLDGAHA